MATGRFLHLAAARPTLTTMTLSPHLPSASPADPADPAAATPRRRYTAFGLSLASDLDLDGLALPAPPDPAATIPPDVVLRLAAAGDAPATARVVVPGLWTDPTAGDGFTGLEVPDVARYRIAGGRTITVDVAPGADPEAVRLFALGTAMGALLMQRRLLVLHGNAFAVDDGCAVVLGHSGAGKSTLAAEMDRRGHAVLSDDVVPIDEHAHAVPGWPRMKLWQDALDRLGAASDALRPVRDGYAKFHLPVRNAATRPLPVRALYVLEWHDAPLRLEPAQGAAVFAHLHEHSYRNRLLVGPQRALHLQRCAELAATASLTRVLRPRGEDSVAASAQAILDDLRRRAADPTATR